MDYISNYELRETRARFWLVNRLYSLLLIQPAHLAVLRIAMDSRVGGQLC